MVQPVGLRLLRYAPALLLVCLGCAPAGVAAAGTHKPLCQIGDALIASVDSHITDWDEQVKIGLNASLNCSSFLEFSFMSRATIRTQLDYIRGNYTADDQKHRESGESGKAVSWALSHLSAASSMLSAHLHVHGVLAAARLECLSEQMRLLFMMSLHRLRSVLQEESRSLWLVLQGTPEQLRMSASRWLNSVVELFDADLRAIDSIVEAAANVTAPDDNSTLDAQSAPEPPAAQQEL
mmetsp:Transcript_35901/g.65898  ORF Transcript_35901/g.65898 Transcript_35901/m.65898 type:complete len:237 (-) Transcript_35901:21-731(-)